MHWVSRDFARLCATSGTAMAANTESTATTTSRSGRVNPPDRAGQVRRCFGAKGAIVNSSRVTQERRQVGQVGGRDEFEEAIKLPGRPRRGRSRGFAAADHRRVEQLLVEEPLEVDLPWHGSGTDGQHARAVTVQFGDLARFKHGRAQQRNDDVLVVGLAQQIEIIPRRHAEDTQRVHLLKARGGNFDAGLLQRLPEAFGLRLEGRRLEHRRVARDEENAASGLPEFEGFLREHLAQRSMWPAIEWRWQRVEGEVNHSPRGNDRQARENAADPPAGRLRRLCPGTGNAHGRNANIDEGWYAISI